MESGQTAKKSCYHNTGNFLPLVSLTEEDAFQRDIAMALSNLAAATEVDRSKLQEMAAANSALTKQLAVVTISLQQALTELANLCVHETPNQPRNPGRRQAKDRTVRKYHNNNYCWSCGFDISDWHNSKTCCWIKPGHHVEATKDNNLGGNQKLCDLAM